MITIIAKDPYGNTLRAKSIEYNPRVHRNLNDIRLITENELKQTEFVACGYSRETQQAILIHHANTINNGCMNWDLELHDKPINTAFNSTDSVVIITIYYEQPFGLGSGGGISMLDSLSNALNLIELIKLIFILFTIAYYYLRPLYAFSKQTPYDEKYIKDTILKCSKWRVGFISDKKFKYKTILEYFIMKKLGYKKLNNHWENTLSTQYKLPHDIFRS